MSSLTLTGGIITDVLKLTGNSQTDLLDRGKRTTVISIRATENNGSTPALTLAITDGTTTWYLRNALAMTAKETVVFDEIFVLDQNKKLVAQSDDAAGRIDLVVTYFDPDATGRS